MKRVLFLATNDFNVFGGGPQAVRAYLDSTLEIFGNDNVDVMIGEEYKLLDEYQNLNVIRIPKRAKIRSLYEIFKGTMSRWSIPLLRFINQHYKEYDLIILNYSITGIIVPSIKKLGLKVVTIHHNEEIEYNMDNKTIYTLGGRWSYWINKAQKKAYKYSDINLFLTTQDKETFELMYGKPNAQINEVIGVYDYKSSQIIRDFESKIDYNIGVSGSLCNYQTTHGIVDIMHNYFDIIIKLIPNCRILFTGRNPSPEIIKIVNDNKKNIEVLPNPEDIISNIQKSSIYLCPTDIGGGLKLRAMDGLKAGLPILVHKVSARGYDMFLGKPYFKVYDDRESFRIGLEELMEFISNINVDTRERISDDYYYYFSYKSGTNRLKQYLNSLVSCKKRTSL